MARIIEYVKIALMNIRSNKGRSFLTMLGIIIGISSVILIVSAGNGFKVGISGQLDELVGDTSSSMRMCQVTRQIPYYLPMMIWI